MTQERKTVIINTIEIVDPNEITAKLGPLKQLYGQELVDYATALAGGKKIKIIQTADHLEEHNPDRDTHCLVIKGRRHSVLVRGINGVSDEWGDFWGVDVGVVKGELWRGTSYGVNWFNTQNGGGQSWRTAEGKPYPYEVTLTKNFHLTAPKTVEYKGRIVPEPYKPSPIDLARQKYIKI